MRAVILRLYNKDYLSQAQVNQNQEQPMGAGWTA